MNDPRRQSRRAIVGAVASGMLLGGSWGAFFPVVAKESRPSLAVVGHRGSQLVLVDSGSGRVLVMLGMPDPELVGRLPAMMTVFRQRIDVIVGDRTALERHAVALRGRWSLDHAVVIQNGSGLPPLPMDTSVVTDLLTVDLGRAMSLRIDVGHRDCWKADHASSGQTSFWSLRVIHPAGDAILTPKESSLDAIHHPPATLLITPDRPRSARHWDVIAANSDSANESGRDDADAMLTRIYPSDVARFIFSDDAIVLPPWTGSVTPTGFGFTE